MKKTDFIWSLPIWYQETPNTDIHWTGPHTGRFTARQLLCFRFLIDRTNGRAIGTLLRPSVCLSVRNVLWLNGA